MARLIALSLIVVALADGPTGAAETAPPSDAQRPNQPALRTTAQKRQWLREQLVKGVRNPNDVRQLRAVVDRLTPRQVHALANAALAQQLPANDQQLLQQAQLELQRAQWLRQLLERELWLRRYGYGYPVGYLPVITWLPQGTTMGASAVVSPDRRYVRVSPMPFFSSVGPVYSYNLNTGRTRLLPQYGYPVYGSPQYYGYPPQGASYGMDGVRGWQGSPQPRSAPRRKAWYERTR